MQKFTRLHAVAAALPLANVDTDTIIRVERCAQLGRHEMGPWAFEPLRYRPDGAENPEFVLNREPFRRAQILVAGENFGCGSSREMAVWALAGFGIRCVIAPSFGEIFFNNCFQNGLLAIRLARDEVEALMKEDFLEIDLASQRVIGNARQFAFGIDPLRKRALLEGLDAIGLTLTREREIAAFQAADRARRPWLYRTR